MTDTDVLKKMEQLTNDEDRFEVIGKYCFERWIESGRMELIGPINMFETLCSAYVLSYRLAGELARQFMRGVYLLGRIEEDLRHDVKTVEIGRDSMSLKQ